MNASVPSDEVYVVYVDGKPVYVSTDKDQAKQVYKEEKAK